VRATSRRKRAAGFVVAIIVGLVKFSQPASAAVSGLIWTDSFSDKLWVSDLDGSSGAPLLELPSGALPRHIATDLTNGHIYWSNEGNGNNGSISRAALDGSGATPIVSGLNGVFGMAVDTVGGSIYWTEKPVPGPGVTARIRRAALDGSGIETLRTGGAPVAIALDAANGKMYWTDYLQSNLSRIRRANLDGSSVEDLVATVIGPQGIALDVSRGKMYWTDSETYKIQRANLDGTGIEDLWTNSFITRPAGIALDLNAEKMYWADYQFDRVLRANLDGSVVEQIVAAANNQQPGPYGIALIPEPTSGALLTLTCAMCLRRRHNGARRRQGREFVAR
jgi:DNA-binding beta-propeller fold protein YncE